MIKRWFAGLLMLAGIAHPQRRVDPKNTYHRVICVVDLIGKGTADDPKRPQYAPWPPSQDPNGIIAYFYRPSDDGKRAVVEFAARNRSAFQALFNDKTIPLVEKGRASKANIEAQFKPFRKDFDLDKFGTVLGGAGLPGLQRIGQQYYFTDNLTAIDNAKWLPVGTVTPVSGGLTAADPNGGSLISRLPI